MDARTGSPKTVDMRALALDLLLEAERGTEYENTLLKGTLDKYDYLNGRDKAFLKRLVDGVTERRLQLDYVLEQFSSLPVRKMKPLIRCVLRMGAYQILFMDGVPDSAACNEAVKLAKKRRFAQLSGFVNGVLRKLCSQKNAIAWPDREKEPVRFLSVRYSMPEWIVRRWLEEYGTEKTEAMLEALLEKRPLTIRLSERLSEKERESLLQAFREQGCMPIPHPLFGEEPSAERSVYMLEGAEGVASLPGFAEGAFAVQDAASMMAVECAGIRELVRIQRQKAGLGVMGRKADIRYRVSPESLSEVAVLQREILSTVWKYVKPGGLLLYSTCTLNREENENMAAWFWQQFPFMPKEPAASLPASCREGEPEGCVRFLPGENGTDGFFIACFRRKQEEIHNRKE